MRMIKETKIYSDFIKRNDIYTKGTIIELCNKTFELRNDNKGWWYQTGYENEEGPFYTKKAAIYFAAIKYFKGIFI